MSESPPFIVVKFLSTDDDEDEIYEVALSKWLKDLDENMIGNLFWPEDSSAAGTLVRTQVNAQSNWSTHTVQVKRYYDTYFQARKGLTGIIEYASAYETDTGKEMGRGKRKKKVKQIESSDELDNDHKNQFMKKKSSIPSPPAVHVPVFKSINSDFKCKRNVNQDSSSIKKLKIAKHQDELTPLENTRENLLKKLVSERKKAVKKAEEKNVKLLTAHSQLQSSLQEQFKSNYVKNPCASENIKSPKKNVFQELYDNAKIKAKEKIKNLKVPCLLQEPQKLHHVLQKISQHHFLLKNTYLLQVPRKYLIFQENLMI